MNASEIVVKTLNFDDSNVSTADDIIMFTFNKITAYPSAEDIKLEQLGENTFSLRIGFMIMPISAKAHHDLSEFFILNKETK